MSLMKRFANYLFAKYFPSLSTAYSAKFPSHRLDRFSGKTPHPVSLPTLCSHAFTEIDSQLASII